MSGDTNCDKPVQVKNVFWNEPDTLPKLPGKVMDEASLRKFSSKNDSGRSIQFSPHHQRSSSHPGRSNNTSANCKSFEFFTASCDDAWDSQIDECLLNDGSATCKSSSAPGDSYKAVNEDKTSGKVTVSEPASTISIASASASSAGKKPSATLSKFESLSKRPVINTMPSSSIIGSKHSPSPPLRQIDSAHQITKKSASNREFLPKSSIDSKSEKLRKLIYEDEVTDLSDLRKIAWAGLPPSFRHITWKLLLGYLPVVRDKRPPALERKRTEYQLLIDKYYNNNRCPNDEIWRQIHIDIPRMQPLISIFQQDIVQRVFQRILYIYSIRHPASGYVQGMNDLVIPFFVVYLSEFIPGNSLTDFESFDVSSLPEDILQGVEADSFWSVKKLLDSIQDNYTFAQPGIQHLVSLLAKIISRIDSNLHEHLEKHNVQYLLFSFRWMNNLLTRELPLRCIIRLWDTYLAEGALISANTSSNTLAPTLDSKPANTSIGNASPFAASFHLYVCAAFLRYWSKKLLKEHDFQGIILFLQNLPTFHWTDAEIELLVADAFSLKETFTPNHLLP